VVRIADSTIRGTADDKAYRAALTVDGKCAKRDGRPTTFWAALGRCFELAAARGTAAGM